MTPCPGVLFRTDAVGVVIPVHNEESLLESALGALAVAVDRVGDGVPFHTVLVFDSCDDGSVDVGRRWARGARQVHHRVSVLEIKAGNVGRARRTGCAAVLDAAKGIDPRRLWLATTDGDSMVPGNWLAAQLADHEAGVDIWSGSVTVADWTHRKMGTAAEWERQYELERDPAHGASLGINGQTYLDAGGFKSLATGEDRALLDSAIARGASCRYDRSAPVITSAREERASPRGIRRSSGSCRGQG